MQTFQPHDDGIEPLEVSGDRMKAEICRAAWSAWQCNEDADLAIKKAADLSEEPESDDHAIAAFMRLATKRSNACQHARSQLARLLSRAGYAVGVKVACASVVVRVNRDLMPVSILGRTPPDTPCEALDAIDDHLDDAGDEAREWAADFSEMVHFNNR